MDEKDKKKEPETAATPAAPPVPAPLQTTAAPRTVTRITLVTEAVDAAGGLPDKITIMPASRPELPRTIWVHGFYGAQSFIEQLWQFVKDDPAVDILVAIDSFGGSVYTLLQMAGAIETCKVPVRTCVFGVAMSAGFFLASCGADKKRYAMPYATGMLHEISSWTGGSLGDMKADVGESERLNDLILSILAKNTGQDAAKIKEMLRTDPEARRDFFFDAAGMKAFGLVNEIVSDLSVVIPDAPVDEMAPEPAVAPTEGGDGQ